MKAKGDVVEQLVAWLHDWPGVRVRKGVRLPALNDEKGTREIDVLLETDVVGYQVRIAIECKNEKGLIGAPTIDAFVGKLDDIGIPSQCGVFVSASGFTGGALRRARKAGIRALVLKGLSEDGLRAKLIVAARQAIIFVCAFVEEVTYFTTTMMPTRTDLMFQDSGGRLVQTIPHWIAQKWLAGDIPDRIGVHDVVLTVTNEISPVFVTLGHRVELATREIHVKVRVLALAHVIEGSGELFQLAHAETAAIEKMGFRVTFPVIGTSRPLTPIYEEAHLNALVPDEAIAVRTFRKVPRIVYNTAYWPISERAARRLAQLSTEQSQETAPSQVSFLDVEEANIRTAWDEGMTVAEFDQYLRSSAQSTVGPP